ncbi:MAG: murein biosynthesis integral membrane protein MurJ [Pseudonocardia sp.]
MTEPDPTPAPATDPDSTPGPVSQTASGTRSEPPRVSLLRASGSMALASLVSRVTGFARQIALVAALGLTVVNDSYTLANTLPNIIYELLLGGVLSSVMVPLLVRAQTEDDDGGQEYTRKLLTVATVVLTAATVVAMLAAPLLTTLYMGSGGTTGTNTANPALATAFALLLLPEIVFYGLGALFGAILNTKGVFGPFAWAPVLNNLVMLAVLSVYLLLPGEVTADFTNPKLLLLGLGATLGIAVQALVLLPALRRVGVRWRPRWGWDSRLSDAGWLALWVTGYVMVGQAGYLITTRVAFAADPGSVATYTNAWLLLQVPYGVLGVSLLTVLLPRMSRSAADGRLAELVSDLSLGARYSAVTLVPVTAMITVFGGSIGVALFSLGRSNADEAARLGATMMWSAFGLLPFALVMLQLRVFYAMKDARTPTLIQLLIVAAKIPMLLVCGLLLPPEQVVLGLAVANALSFVVGAVVGQLWLYRRLGPLGTGAVLVTTAKTVLAAGLGGLAGFGVLHLLPSQGSPVGTAWLELGVGGLVEVLVTVAVLLALRLSELAPLMARLRSR